MRRWTCDLMNTDFDPDSYTGRRLGAAAEVAAASRPAVPRKFNKHLDELTSRLPAPLPSFDAIVSTTRPASVLEIGCGEAVALLEVTALLEAAGRRRAGGVCAACLNRPEYYDASEPTAYALKYGSVRGSVHAGNSSRAALAAVAARAGVRMPRATPAVLHGNFHDGLAFGDRAFDLLLSQHALNEGAPPADASVAHACPCSTSAAHWHCVHACSQAS